MAQLRAASALTTFLALVWWGSSSGAQTIGQARTVLVDTSIPFTAGAMEGRIEPTSALAWDRFQAGQVGGWWYRIDPDGAAVFARDPTLSEGRMHVRCGPTECRLLSRASDPGSPIVPVSPLDRENPFPAYADWVLTGAAMGVRPEPEPAPEPEPEPEPVAPPEPEIIVQIVEVVPEVQFPPPIPLNGGTEISALQAGLAMLGYEPGLADGFLGPRTIQALDQFRATATAPPPDTDDPASVIVAPDAVADLTGLPTQTDLAAVLIAVNDLLLIPPINEDTNP